jgi:hypothetical protein
VQRLLHSTYAVSLVTRIERGGHQREGARQRLSQCALTAVTSEQSGTSTSSVMIAARSIHAWLERCTRAVCYWECTSVQTPDGHRCCDSA